MAVLIVAMTATSASAYVGPGAGFAFLTSALALALTFFAFVFGILLWPFRLLYRLVTWKRRPHRPRIRRAVVVGLDGLDPDRAEKMMERGELPALKKLSSAGTFKRLATTHPAMSPVAWSSFATGCEPSKHGIFDFFVPDPKTYLPELSSTRIDPPARQLEIGGYRIPLSKPQVRLLRKSRPFWSILGKYRVPCSILRVPITFPPEKFGGTMLSAMCVPDLLGTQGTFTYLTSEPPEDKESVGGRTVEARVDGDLVTAHLEGPSNPFKKDDSPLRVPVEITKLDGGKKAMLEVSGQRVELELGEFTEWVKVSFPLAGTMKLRGLCRFRLLELEPHFRMYCSPLNIDPEKPAMPISEPRYFSAFLSKLCGPFATLGLAEDTWAVNEGVLDEDAFLDQAWSIHAERESMFFELLRRAHKGAVACVFDGTDRIQHMFMRQAESQRDDEPHREVIEETYRKMDEMLERVLEEVDIDDPKNLVMVISDHGFKPFRRSINLNAWLVENGYLVLKKGADGTKEWLRDVDWSETKAYSMGLAGIYFNLEGREAHGTVEPEEERQRLAAEISDKLTGLEDPKDGKTAISSVYRADEIYRGPYAKHAPDLIVGYAPGWRACWNGARGMVTSEVFSDNEKAWSGDHCIDPEAVPGVLFCNHSLGGRDAQARIIDIGPTLLDLFGIPAPPYMDGRSLARREGKDEHAGERK